MEAEQLGRGPGAGGEERAVGQEVLELAAGEFTRIILSTNQSANLIDKLKLSEPPTEADSPRD